MKKSKLSATEAHLGGSGGSKDQKLLENVIFKQRLEVQTSEI